ncbi:hypothetical protein GCM10010171_25620 [Actinokineospora fastidiosa]|uniref:Uncharacterized protein n=1 Tax=Actinokineospora fastidiosa TaxID=1816 RepID=A0A918GEJ5_9PSEU|nr:hypothetical protein GCM10010171_25620 [Actinokineospora fastidiosa]
MLDLAVAAIVAEVPLPSADLPGVDTRGQAEAYPTLTASGHLRSPDWATCSPGWPDDTPGAFPIHPRGQWVRPGCLITLEEGGLWPSTRAAGRPGCLP